MYVIEILIKTGYTQKKHNIIELIVRYKATKTNLTYQRIPEFSFVNHNYQHKTLLKESFISFVIASKKKKYIYIINNKAISEPTDYS